MKYRSDGFIPGFRKTKWVVLIMVLASAMPQGAAEERLDLARVAPVKNLASNQELKEEYARLSTKPYGREDLACSLIVPKDWRDIPITISTETLQQATEIFIPLTEQRAPAVEEGNALIEVRYTELDMEMALCDVVDASLESFGYEVLMRRQGTYSGREVDEALIRTVQDGEDYLARLTYSRHGNKVFLVNGSVKEALIDHYAKILGTAAVSFRVTNKAASEFAQPMSKYSSEGRPRLSFRYPTPHWDLEELEENRADVTAASLALRVRAETPEEGKTYALIYVEVAEKNEDTSPDQIKESLTEVFRNAGLTFDERRLAMDLEPQVMAPLGKLERWDTTLGALPAEVTLLLMPKGNTIVSLGLFSMRRSDNPYGWMTAWRVFEIVAGDVLGKPRSLSAARKLIMPSDNELNEMAAETLRDFALAVVARDFSGFHATMAQTFRSQMTADQLHGNFRNFSEADLDLVSFEQTDPVMTASPYVQSDGVLKVAGFFFTEPLRTHFKLSYVHEFSTWKLIGIHVSLKEEPIASQPERAGGEVESESQGTTD